MRFDRKIVVLIFLFAALLLVNYYLYTTLPKPTTSKENVEVYSGTLPCTDCDGVKATLILTRDTDQTGGSYVLQTEYLGKSIAPFEIRGEWETLPPSSANSNAAIVALNSDRKDEVVYFVRERNGSLTPLDKNQNRIQSKTPYSLERVEVKK